MNNNEQKPVAYINWLGFVIWPDELKRYPKAQPLYLSPPDADAMRKQRDELLEALECVVSAWSEQFERYGHMAPEWAKKARNAISSVKGVS